VAIKLPTVKPTVKLPTAPQPVKPSMTAFGTYPPGTMIGQLAPLKPMPDAVKNNINLGWNYATGQVVQPLTPQQKAQVAIPPIGNLGIKIPTQTVYPTPAPNKTNLVNTIMNVASAPVKPMPLMPAQQATQLKTVLSPLIPSQQAIARTQQNLAINQFLPKKSVASQRAPVAPERMVGYGRY
jgi:hypothetical protein